MNLYELLEHVHRLYAPRTYLEIGVEHGHSLALSRAASVGIDPYFKIKAQLRGDLQLVRAYSDEFFTRPECLAHLCSAIGREKRDIAGVVDLALIDGQHTFDAALRDFINVERCCHGASIVIFDDVLPRRPEEATRTRGEAIIWAGDVYKVREILRQYRPDLITVLIDSEPTGTMLVLGANPKDDTLQNEFAQIYDRYYSADPQTLPGEIVARKNALTPLSLLSSPLWPVVRQCRERMSQSDFGISVTSREEMRTIISDTVDKVDSCRALCVAICPTSYTSDCGRVVARQRASDPIDYSDGDRTSTRGWWPEAIFDLTTCIYSAGL